jgi:uncharacterized protein YndB with AHSA1/START domain
MSSAPAARAVADIEQGVVLARVDIKATPERVFRALTTSELTKWWGSDELYRTTTFTMDLRPGGAWRSQGVGSDGSPFSVSGEVVAVDAPHTLVQTWAPDWDPGPPTTITWRLEATDTGTRVTLRHTGFEGRAQSCDGHAMGWERVLGWLGGHTADIPSTPGRYFLVRLLAPRPTFMLDMTDEERAVMGEHVGYWGRKMADGVALAFGPVADPKGAWGLGLLRASDEAAIAAFEAADPAVASGRGFRYEVLPMPQLIHAGA